MQRQNREKYRCAAIKLAKIGVQALKLLELLRMPRALRERPREGEARGAAREPRGAEALVPGRGRACAPRHAAVL